MGKRDDVDVCYPLAKHFLPMSVIISFSFSSSPSFSLLIFSFPFLPHISFPLSLQQLDITAMELTAITKAREDTLYRLSSRISSDPGNMKIKDYLKVVRKVRKKGDGRRKQNDLLNLLLPF